MTRKSTSWFSKVGASGNVMSDGVRLPNGSQMSDGLNRNRSDADTTVTSTSPCSSCFTASAAVKPPKFPPRTRTFLRDLLYSSRLLPHRVYGHAQPSNRDLRPDPRALGPSCAPAGETRRHGAAAWCGPWVGRELQWIGVHTRPPRPAPSPLSGGGGGPLGRRPTAPPPPAARLGWAARRRDARSAGLCGVRGVGCLGEGRCDQTTRRAARPPSRARGPVRRPDSRREAAPLPGPLLRPAAGLGRYGGVRPVVVRPRAGRARRRPCERAAMATGVRRDRAVRTLARPGRHGGREALAPDLGPGAVASLREPSRHGTAAVQGRRLRSNDLTPDRRASRRT